MTEKSPQERLDKPPTSDKLPELHQFVWPIGVHRWVDPPGVDPQLVRVALSEKPLYEPLSAKTGLFKTFADLPVMARTEKLKDEILRFANTCGMLTVGEPVLVDDGSLGPGERLSYWRTAINELSGALRLLGLLRNNDETRLSRVIRWRGSAVSYRFDQQSGLKLIAATAGDGSAEYRPDLLRGVRPGDVIKPAWYHLQDIVNQKLAGNLSACLLWDRGDRAKQDHPNLYHRPKNLISAMWLQLANDIDGNRKYNRCEGCRRWFEVGSPPRTPRGDAKHCGGTCRQRARRASEKQKAGVMGSSE